MSQGPAIGLGEMVMALAGGFALFLFGMGQISEALKAAAGEHLKLILARLTTNRFTAALTGTAVTAVIQSSSVTTVLVVGFVSAGTMTLTQAVGVIMGANVGTTVTAQILAFKITKYALLLVAAGFALLFTGRSDRTRQYGKTILGLGLVFLGMSFMGEAVEPLRRSAFFLDFMQAVRRPLTGILAGAFFTALLQSSSATTGIVVVMASQGVIPLSSGIALALGANIGTCVTALLAAIGKPAAARRAALVHLLFNTGGALLWVAFIDELALLATEVSPRFPALSGAERLAAEAPRQIANANTIFNLINSLLFLPLAGLFGELATRLVPERHDEVLAAVKPKYLDTELLSTPALALSRVRLELGHMGELVSGMFSDLWEAFSAGRLDRLEEVASRDEGVDALEQAVVEYLSDVRKAPLSDRESSELGCLMAATAFMENLGDLVESELVPLAREAVTKGLYGGGDALRSLYGDLFSKVTEAVVTVSSSVREDDSEAAAAVLSMKGDVDSLVSRILTRQSRELSVSGERDFRVFRFQTEFLERLRRVYTLTKRLARTVLDNNSRSASE